MAYPSVPMYTFLFGTWCYSSLSESDDFVVFDFENAALFAHVLCDIPDLRINLISIFEWKHCQW